MTSTHIRHYDRAKKLTGPRNPSNPLRTYGIGPNGLSSLAKGSTYNKTRF